LADKPLDLGFGNPDATLADLDGTQFPGFHEFMKASSPASQKLASVADFE
jgi:hypothetical protein